MIAAIEDAKDQRDTLGGVFEVLGFGFPGIGSHVHYDRRLDALLATAIMSIPAIKSRSRDGFQVAALPGRSPMMRSSSTSVLTRPTNRAGGAEVG